MVGPSGPPSHNIERERRHNLYNKMSMLTIGSMRSVVGVITSCGVLATLDAVVRRFLRAGLLSGLTLTASRSKAYKSR